MVIWGIIIGGMKINIKTLKCLRCGNEWTPRIEDVRQCPKCKSASWDKPKVDSGKVEVGWQKTNLLLCMRGFLNLNNTPARRGNKLKQSF